ncbi:MAG TPA: SDR family oxidoreductase [Dehalococcoidia bacterium]|nr:SDR family oxidoreductase [Dehalococcoidia bacterium]
MTLSMFDLTDRVAIVTGSGRGIGKGIALGLAEAGATVVVTSRTPAEIEATASEIRDKGGTALAIATDMMDPEQVSNLVQKTVSEFGKLDIMVNNAGGSTGISPALELSLEDWEGNLRWNLTSAFLGCQAAAKIMIPQRRGSIINIGSIAAIAPQPGRVHYCAAKAGIDIMTKTLAMEWGRYNVRVNAIRPGTIWTSALERNYQRFPEDYDFRLRLTPLGRHGTPRDLVGVTIFLASDASAFVTGASFAVDGGLPIVASVRKDDPSSFW